MANIKCTGVAEVDATLLEKTEEEFLRKVDTELLYLMVDLRTCFLEEYNKAKKVRENG